MKRLLVLFPLALLLSGCWDYNEATMQEYVLGIGIDPGDAGEYQVTIETADLSGSPESLGGNRLIKTSGANLFDAIRNAIPHAGKKLYWGHCGLIVIHEDITGTKLHEVLDVFNRAQDVYLNTALAVAHGVSAAEIFNADYGGSDSITAHFLNVFQNQDSSRRFQRTELWQYTRALDLHGCAMLPTVTLTDDMPALNGGAIYRGTDLVGLLSGEEVLLYSLLTEEISGGWLPETMVSPDCAVSLEILANHTVFDQSGLYPTVTVSLSSADRQIMVQDQTTRAETEQVLADTLQTKIEAFVLRAQQESFSDLLDLPASPQIPVRVTVRLLGSGMYYNQAEETT